eukprot:9384-Heterococcus_DN1.PRE.4
MSSLHSAILPASACTHRAVKPRSQRAITFAPLLSNTFATAAEFVNISAVAPLSLARFGSAP